MTAARWAAAVALALASAACARDATGPRAPHVAPPPSHVVAFLSSRLVPWPAGGRNLLAVTDARTHRVAVYDSALVALVLLRRGHRDVAGRILSALASLQAPDGSIPFSFVLPAAREGAGYVRVGAVAWVGYAAAEYLDAEQGGEARSAARDLARGAARYVMSRQISAEGDPRRGLVRGGTGTMRYEVTRGVVREVLVPGEIDWVSVEHNVDAYFFLRALARVTGDASYDDAAARIARALVSLWSAPNGQLARGASAPGEDPVLALDCASWGSLFLRAAGEARLADTAAAVADGRYASRDPATGARGHRPYAAGPLLEDARLMDHYRARLPAATWDGLDAVWPEGSAGVAFAALRAGRLDRARAILDDLEPLRDADSALPSFTVEVPFTFDTGPSIAGTAWADLVRFELERPRDRPTLWVP